MARRFRGAAAVYMVVSLLAFCAIVSMAVDYARVQLAKTELRHAADSASRAGAAGVTVDAAEAVRLARDFAARNAVDGRALSLDAALDIEIGRWNPNSAKFQKLNDNNLSNADAVRVIARRSSARGTAIPMMFAGALGFSACDVSAESVSMVIPGILVDQSVPGTANPFLAGMPPGAVASATNPHKSGDVAGTPANPKQSPIAVNMKVEEGFVFHFDSIDGVARHDPGLSYFQPDGDLTDIGHNNLTLVHANNYMPTLYSENGIADVVAPVNALVGLFLSDERPDKTPTPPSLDFSTDQSRDFTRLEPQLKQIFFIGDGLNSNAEPQDFVAPKGATRLYIATWDFYEWNNNAGSRNIKVIRPMRIITVQ
jgi:hypothetical protein